MTPLHAIDTSRHPGVPRLTVSAAIQADGLMETGRGTIQDIWVEDDRTVGLWVSERGTRFLILTGHNPRYINDDRTGLIGRIWYLDASYAFDYVYEPEYDEEDDFEEDDFADDGQNPGW